MSKQERATVSSQIVQTTQVLQSHHVNVQGYIWKMRAKLMRMTTEAVEKLKSLGKQKKGGNHKEIKHLNDLMELTKLRRYQWIREECPLIYLMS